MVLRAALVGAGMMGRNHARVLHALDGVELVAVVDADGDPRGARGSASLFTSLDEVPSGSIDLAVVATPTSSHESVVLELLDLRVHVMVEKPVADSVDAGRRMATRAEQMKLVGAVGHIERFNPAAQELKRRLTSGEIGQVHQIATRRQGSFPRRIGDVGVTKDLATHDFDLTAWIAGSPYELVFAQVAHKSGRRHEDMVSVTGRLRSGVMVNHLVNWLSPMKERVVVVSGDKGTLIADTLSADLTLHENGAFAVEWDSFETFRGVTEGDSVRYAYDKKEPLVAELEAFRDAVLGKKSEIVSFSEGVEVVRVAEAVIESSENAAPVLLG